MPIRFVHRLIRIHGASKQYVQYYDQQREAVETPEFSSGLHEYDNASGKRVLDV